MEREEAKLVQFDTAIRRLRQQKAHSTRLIHHFASLLTPINYLPNEVLMLVFLELLQFDKRSAPWIVAGVGQRWRKVAISCSGLWGNFFFMATENSAGTKLRSTHLPRQLRRAGIKRDRSTLSWTFRPTQHGALAVTRRAPFSEWFNDP